LAILLVVLGGRHFVRKTPIAAIPVNIRTLPAGATIRVENKGSGVNNLALNLEPGSYHVEASLPGYEPLSTTITVKPGSTDYPLSLVPAAQSLLVTTSDFPSGQVSLDGNAVGNLESGSLLLPKIAVGQHVLTISSTDSNTQEAKINFLTKPGAMPEVSRPIESNQLQTIAVSTKPGTAHITSSLAPIAASVDDKAAGQVDANGLEVKDLQPGVHTLTLGEGANLRSMSFEVGTVPGLDAIVYSDREVGGIVLSVNEDDTEVFLDGHRYPRRTRSGGLIIPDLPTTAHTIRVSKPGFAPSEVKKVTVVKGQEARVKFTIQPLLKLATLVIDHMTPGAQILIDNVFIGSVGSDGTFTSPYIRPGDHSLVSVIQNRKSGHLSRTFGSGETVHLSNPKFPLPEATLQVAVSAGTTVTVMQNSDVIRQFTGPQKLTLGEGAYVITARDPDGAETKERIYLAPDSIATFPASKGKN
jgi:hypothetical protein